MHKNHVLFIIGIFSAILVALVQYPAGLHAQEQELLQFIESEYVPASSIDGLYAAMHMAVSPDGKNLYITGYGEHAIAVFSIDSLTGKLSFREVYKNGTGGATVLSWPQGIDVSPDGKNVYVGSGENTGLVVYLRDSLTGKLTFLEEHRTSLIGGFHGTHGTRDVIVSKDGRHVYITGYYSDAVLMLERNQSNGALDFIGIQNSDMPGIPDYFRPVSATISADDKHVYIAGFGGYLAVFSREITTGMLTYVEVHKDDTNGIDGLSWARSVAISPDDKHVYVCGENDDAIAMFRRDATTGTLTFGGVIKNGVDGFSGLQGVYQAQISPNGNYLYAIGGEYTNTWQHDAVTVFERDSVTGELTRIQLYEQGKYGADYLREMRGIVITPDGQNVYTASYRDHAVSHFRFESIGAFLSYQTAVLDGSYEKLSPKSVVVSSDGKHVYAPGKTGVGIFARDEISGSLDFLEIQDYMPSYGSSWNGVQCVAISPDGDHVYAAGYEGDIVVFDRNEATGKLTVNDVYRLGVPPIDLYTDPSSITVSPDGSHVFMTGGHPGFIQIFSRDPVTGALEQQQRYQGYRGMRDAWEGINDIAVSHDGRHVYGATKYWDMITVFKWNDNADSLQIVQELFDDKDGVHGLDGASNLTISPDGEHVYVASGTNNTVVAFQRNQISGKLTHLEVKKHGIDSVDFIQDPNAIAISPDGTHVFVTSATHGSVAIFLRNASTGLLTYIEKYSQWWDTGMGDLSGAGDVTVSPDGSHVYVAGQDADAIVVFQRDVSTTAVPHDYALYQNVPNPFNPQTAIFYKLTQPETVQLSIYNLLGQEVRQLQNEELPAGVHSVVWDGTNKSGVAVASGVYIYTLRIGDDFVRSRKMLLLR
jgi:6-phosphogluconolactonase (cycloisomerase 2 family)